MNNSIIGNYLCEAVSEDGFFLMHLDRKDYITDKEGNRIVFKTVDKYSSLSGSFVAERAEGGLFLIDDNGISIDFVFEDIGYENGNNKYYRPVKYIGENKSYWTYCIRDEKGTNLLTYDLDISISEDEDVRLGEKLGNGKYFSVEHYPHQGIPYKTLGFIKSEITTNRYSSLKCVIGEKECIVGKELNGQYILFGPPTGRSRYRPFDEQIIPARFSVPPFHSHDCIYWVGLLGDTLLFVDYREQKRCRVKGYNGGELSYNEDLNVLLEFDPADKSSICNIWDVVWRKNIYESHLWKEFHQTGADMFRVIDRVGRSYDLTLAEIVRQQREFWDELNKKMIEVNYHNKRMREAVNGELKTLGHNALRSFCKTTSFRDWTAYYYQFPRVELMESDMKVIIIPSPMTKTEAPALMLVNSYVDRKLYVCSRLKTRLEERVFFLTVLFELEDFDGFIFRDIPSGAKIKVADLFDDGKESLLYKLTGKRKTPKVEDPQPSKITTLMQQICKHDSQQTFPSIEVDFDGIKYDLVPQKPWTIATDPFYKNTFLPKSNGVFVLLDDSFVNEPMRAMATTEGAFSSIPDYMIEGVGQDGQYISNGNANGHIILKRKDIYLFYRAEDGTLRFFDHATYWGHSEHGVTHPVLHIYLKSMLRKKC